MHDANSLTVCPNKIAFLAKLFCQCHFHILIWILYYHVKLKIYSDHDEYMLY